MKRKLELALLHIAELIYRVTWQAWMKLARRSYVGELLAKWRHAEQRCSQLEAELDRVRGRMARLLPLARPQYSKQQCFETLYHIKRKPSTPGTPHRIKFPISSFTGCRSKKGHELSR